jgi:mannose-1-phosphate guanylyltransferase
LLPITVVRRTYTVVLAGGEGTRLSALTAALYGDPVPKQYASIVGQRTLLQQTIERIRQITPEHRTLVVVNSAHLALAVDQLAPWPLIEIVVEPEGRGTASGILLPLAKIVRRDPDAVVAIFPSDHHVPRPEPFLRAVRSAIDAASRSAGVVLVGAAPEGLETDYGWIVPAVRGELDPLEPRPVELFVEKPSAELAGDLLERGALWNTFVSAGRASSYCALFAEHVPEHSRAFQALASADAPDQVAKLYRSLPVADFSVAVLEHARGLRMVGCAGSCWSDWGTPARVLRSLDGTQRGEELRRSLSEKSR